jgi:A/G-specific adenine glycosylase
MSADPAQTERIGDRLVAWYAKEARNLPWRQTDDPYAILVSEVMLQQTRIETALPYYERFLKRFPTVGTLADAPLDDVLRAWEGLGYYARARNLHRAAQIVSIERDGRLPDTYEGLLELPGVGPYTAAAVASIAFGRDEPVLDGNVIRVLARLFSIRGNPRCAEVKKRLRSLAQMLLRRGQAASLNQALMDLGARICQPRTPRCDACPIAALCNAHRTGQETSFPPKQERRKAPHVDVVAGLIWSGASAPQQARLLIAKREPDDMLGGLWEIPGGHREDEETLEDALQRELREELAIDVEVLASFMQVKHAYSHFRMTLHVFHCRHLGGAPRAIECSEWRWVRVSELDQYAFAAADRKVLDALDETLIP